MENNKTIKLTGLTEEEIGKVLSLLQILDLDTGRIVDFNSLPTRLSSLSIFRKDPISIHFEEDLTIIRF